MLKKFNYMAIWNYVFTRKRFNRHMITRLYQAPLYQEIFQQTDKKLEFRKIYAQNINFRWNLQSTNPFVEFESRK